MSAIVAGAWMVGSAVVSGVMSNRQKSIQNNHLLATQARKEAAIDTDIARKQEALSAQAREIQEVQQRNQLRIDQQGAVIAADAQVASAAAGVTGQSTDMTQMAVEFSTGTRMGQIQRQEAAQINRLEQMSRDIKITGESAKAFMDIDDSPTGAGIANLLQNIARSQIGFSV